MSKQVSSPVASVDYAALYNAQKGITKKEAVKIKPGTVVEVRFIDGPNEKVIITENHIPDGRNDFTYLVRSMDMRGRIDEYQQIVKILDTNVLDLIAQL